MNSELVNIIKELIGNVTAFLHDDDNSWDDPYEVMRGMIVEDTLNKALAIPQLHDWATDTLAAAAVWAEMRAEMEKQEAAEWEKQMTETPHAEPRAAASAHSKEDNTMKVEVDLKFIAEVKKLVTSVRRFLRNDDGNDHCFIERMDGDITRVLERARKIPELKYWATNMLADTEQQAEVFNKEGAQRIGIGGART